MNITAADIGKKFRTRDNRIVTLTGGSIFDKWPWKVEDQRGEVATVRNDGTQSYEPGGEEDWDLIGRVADADDELLPLTTEQEKYIEENIGFVTKDSGGLLNSVKDSNPKDAVGVRKIPMSCVSMPVVLEMAAGMMEGARKYGRHNYRVIGVRASVYFDAAMRHLVAWWEGEDIDEASGISHISKAMSTLHVLRDAMIRDKMVDDRPPGTAGFIAALNDLAANICERFPEGKDPFLSQGPPDQYVA